jgi:CarD family transcriptional regulator
MFKIGERVVHPQHGVGEITKLKDREFEPGKTRRYYEISFPGGSTLWVPIDYPDSGLRHPASRSEIAKCRKVLAAKPKPVTVDGRLRQSDLVARLRQGTVAAQCEAVRDLSAHLVHKPLPGILPTFLEAIQGALGQEWAIVEGIPIADATSEIVDLLKQSRATVAGK